MNESNAPAGWYPAAHANNEQRYWDGSKWLDLTPPEATLSTASAPTQFGESTAAYAQRPIVATAPYPGGQQAATAYSGSFSGTAGTSKRLAIIALVVGIVAFLTGWVPILGLVLAVAAVALAVAALVKKQPKGFALTGLILGALALITSLIVTIAFLSFVSGDSASSSDREVPAVETTPEASESAESEPAASAEPAPVPVAPATPDLATFGVVDDRTFALIAKEPDAHVGTNFIVFGVVSQLDAATGPCSMLLNAAEAQREMSYDYEQSTFAFSGDGESMCPVFDPLVEGDHVKMWVTVLGSFSYDTQIGGNTTVPAFEVWQAELLPAQEY